MAATVQRFSSKQNAPQPSVPSLADGTELVGLQLELQPLHNSTLYPQYTVGLHAWLLNQVRQDNPNLSAYLHDGESEKPFTLSGLQELSPTAKQSPKLEVNQTYTWIITALSPTVVQWLQHWLQCPPEVVDLRNAPLQIKQWSLIHPPTTYTNLLPPIPTAPPTLSLSFLSPTSFRRKGHHFPLPVPRNLFQSYLRRWSDFSGEVVDQEDFLDWIDDYVVITRHRLESVKMVAGKKGAVTGFTGAIELSLTHAAMPDEAYVQLFLALGQLAPYCSTGHKTTFGLGQTRLGWTTTMPSTPTIALEDVLAQRITELTDLFKSQRKRTGGDRASSIAERWATVLARRELGESLQAIADDLDMPYETVKTYVKLARQAVKKN